MTYRVLCADALAALADMPENSIDSLVTDPPAGIAFMGKSWDRPEGVSAPTFDSYRRAHNENDASRENVFGRTSRTAPHSYGESDRGEFIAGMRAIFEECLRVLNPGAHGLVWALPRTSHWTATALEDAGFEVRDTIVHLFGSGFPKSLDVSKAIDKLHGAHRETKRVEYNGELMRHGGDNTRPWMEAALEKGYHELPGDKPSTEDAARWDGWGTALKPASEHWILVRKPLSEKNVAANVLKWGTGAINIDACRIGSGEGGTREGEPSKERRYVDRGTTNFAATPGPRGGSADGRWPANVVLSHTIFCDDEEGCSNNCPVRMLDEQSGVRESGKPSGYRNATIGFQGGGHVTELTGYGDRGGASRFFFVAKPSSAEKHEALKKLSLFDADPHAKPKKNAHPTVKPVELMRYFVRMVTPPGGTVLDCFGGSGTTGIAAIAEQFDVVLIEREPDYARTAEVRMAQAALERGAA